MKEFLPKSALLFTKMVLRNLGRSTLVIATLLLIVGQSLFIALPGILGLLIDRIFVQDRWTTYFLVLFPITWFLAVVISAYGKFYSSRIVQDVRKVSKDLIFRHIVSMPNSVYTVRGAGEVEGLMHELSFNARFIFSESFPFFIRTLVSLLVAMCIIWSSSVALSWMFLLWALVYIPISYVSAKRSVKSVAESIHAAAEVADSTVEVIENHELLPAFGTEQFEISRFGQILEKERICFNKGQREIDGADFFQRILQVFLPLGIVLFLIFSGQLLQMTPGSIASLFSITLILTNQIGDFGRGILAFFEMQERMTTALEKLAPPPQFTPTFEKYNDIEPASWDIRFENVSFHYEESREVLHKVSLEIKENEKIGIIGYSGAGKTTLIKLLRGFFSPDRGQIFIGGVALETVNPGFLAKNMAQVSQSIPLFHRTLRENVVYGYEDASDEKIWEILEKAQLADYVKKLPRGLDTVIGVRGQKFSGGERARIGIARAFIRNAKIIILDEATASIDSEAELLIQKGLEELMKGRTVIAIAHRLSTLRAMERIIVLDKGTIAAQGTHKELIAASPLYNSLWNAQILI
jgi:ABC-type multidrug transport system fused ATPase/permease subunit